MIYTKRISYSIAKLTRKTWLPKADRQNCLKSGNIPTTEGGRILPHHCNSLMNSMKFDRHKKGFAGAKVFHSEHVVAYPQPQFYDMY